MTETTIEIDIPDETFLALAKLAHERGITFNELCVSILQDYVDGKLSLSPEDVEQGQILDKLRHATTDVVEQGVTVETMRNFGYAFLDWNMQYHGEVTASEIIQTGFDEANLR